MRREFLASVAAVTIVAGCSQADQRSPQATDAHEAPNVSPTAAPGVAWRYSYNYQLRDDAISKVQEAHASACESLGTAKCRITGLNYSVGEDDTVSAMLEVKLAPELARQFGKAATGQVTNVGGKLLSTQFTGEDVTPASSEAARRQQDINAQIVDLEDQLKRATTAEERNALNARLGELRGQLSYARGTLAEASEKLASTPMTFNYYGRGGIAGFKTNPVEDAARSFVSSLVTMVTVVLQALALILPWALLLALLVALARTRPGRAVRNFFAPRASEPLE